MHKKVTILPISFFLIISAILIFCWFREGLLYGGGDTGIPTYNPKVMAHITGNIWWESLAPGIPVAQGLTSVPLLFFLSIPQVLGASPVFIQAFLFFILLFLMGYGMYLLSLSVFGRSNYLMAFSAGIFYLFNPYMMIQIWHRFIHNSMVFVAFLPFLVLTWAWWIRKRNPLYLLLFLLVNFLAVYVFGTIAFIVALWVLLFLLTLLEISIPWKDKKVVLKLVLCFFIAFFFWILMNSWWLIPTFSVSTALFAEQHTTDDSLSNLVSLSKQTILLYSLRLINPFYLYWHADWGNIYQNIFLILASWIFVPVVFVGFIKGLKEKAYIIWSLLFLAIIFLAKGAAAPFSFLYIFGFSHFFPLGVIRNPFEKLGILLPLIFALLFALGLQVLLTTLTKRVGKSKTIIFSIIFICFYLSFFWPMFTGNLFGSLERSMLVDVPQSYTQANTWIKQDLESTNTKGEGRILHLPLPQSEDVRYKWQYGYSGVEPSAAIFTSLPSIARGLDIPRVGDSLSTLSLIFHKPYAENDDKVLDLLRQFNIKYIILHKDIQWRGSNLYDPAEVEEMLSKLIFIDKSAQFGDLIIYKVKDAYYQNKITVVENVRVVFPGKNNIIWPWLIGNQQGNFVSPMEDFLNENILAKSNEVLLLPKSSFLFLESTKSASLNSSIKDSSISQLINIKNLLIQYGEIPAEELRNKIILANQTLIKIVNSFNSAQSDQVETLVVDYGKLVREIFRKDIHDSRLLLYIDEFNISNIFKEHLAILAQIKVQMASEATGKVESLLRENLEKNALIPIYPESNFNEENPLRQIFKFKIPVHSHYKILMTNSQSKDYYPNALSEVNFQINERPLLLKGEITENYISFGEVELNPGEYEISYVVPKALNLAFVEKALNSKGDVKLVDESTINMSSIPKEGASLEINIENVRGGDIYNLSFEIQVPVGNGFHFQMEQDTDSIDASGAKIPQVSEFISQNSSNEWKNYNLSLPHLRSTTQKVVVRFVLSPPQTGLFTLSSIMNIRNLKVERLLNNSLVLSTNLANQVNENLSGTLSEVIKKSSGRYEGKLNLLKPSFVFFNETYNPGWKLKLQNADRNIFSPDQTLLSNLYGNAWFVDKLGRYSFSIEFEPQQKVSIGIIVAGFAFIIVLLGSFTRIKYKNKHES